MTYTKAITNTVLALTIAGLTIGAGVSLAFAQEVDLPRNKASQQRGFFGGFGQEHRGKGLKNSGFGKGFRAFGHKMRGVSVEGKEALKALREETKERLENATTDEEREVIKKDAKTQHEALRAQFKTERADSRPERRGDIGSRVERIMKRLNSATEHLTNLGGRVQNFLNEKSAAGVDTTAAQNKLNEANTKLGEAKAAIIVAQSVIDRILASDNPSDHKDEVREAVRNSISEIKETHKAIREAVRATKVLNN